MNRQFSKWFGSRPIMYCATTPSSAVSTGSGDGGGGATGGGGAPPVPAAPAPTGGGASGGTGGQPPAGAAPGQTGIENLRKEYDGLKSKYEPWEKLGIDPGQAGMSHAVYQRIFQDAGAIGRELGYPDKEIIEALQEDPIATIDFLRNEAFQRERGGGRGDGQDDGRDLTQQIQERIDQAIGPIQQRENLRITNEANAIFERTVHQLVAEQFTKEGIDIGKASQDEIALLTNATSEIMKYDEAGLKSLKFEGKTAPIQKAFQEALTMIDKYYLARAARERGAVGGGPRPGAGQQPVGQPGKKPSLEDMINDPDSIRRAQGKPAYGT